MQNQPLSGCQTQINTHSTHRFTPKTSKLLDKCCWHWGWHSVIYTPTIHVPIYVSPATQLYIDSSSEHGNHLFLCRTHLFHYLQTTFYSKHEMAIDYDNDDDAVAGHHCCDYMFAMKCFGP